MQQALSVASVLGAPSFLVFRSDELRAAGIHPDTVTRLVTAGQWQLLWRGVYLCSAEPPTALQRAWAAVKHAGAPGRTTLVTGLAGAAGLGMRWVPDRRAVQVLVGAEVYRTSTPGVLVRRAWDVDLVPTWRWGGLLVAEPARLVVDGARECSSLRDVRGLVLGAVADRHCTTAEIREILDRGAVGGTALTRRAARDADQGALSPPEAELVDILRGRGFDFLVNPLVWVGAHFVGRFDVLLLGTGIGLEVDSEEHHSRPSDLSATLERHGRAAAAGLELLHVTPRALRADPLAFVDRIHREVARRRAGGVGEPLGLRALPSGPLLR